MAYAHGLPQAVVAQGQAILEATGKAVGEIKDDFIEFLEEQNLVQKGVLLTHAHATQEPRVASAEPQQRAQERQPHSPRRREPR